MGGAGTGKSFLVKQMRKRFKPYVSASTGIAAQNVHGTTLHSLLGMRPHDEKPNYRRVERRLYGHNMLILDEISMINSWMFDIMLDALRTAAPAVKLVCVGDFMQLPPVQGRFAFYSNNWNMVTPIVLSTQHRQRDPEFIGALYDVRVGQFSARLQEMLNQRTMYNLPKDSTLLASCNSVVGAVNDARLMELPGKHREYEWKADIKSQYMTEDRLMDRCRFPRMLYAKKGARVVMLTNAENWMNGSTGEVVGCGREVIHVRLDGGGTVPVERVSEEVIGGDKQVLATVNQFPMKLAFALTIHKAQGMTMDRVSVDLNNHFAKGQTYVALSRCRTKEGLHLFGTYVPAVPDRDALRVCGG
jgi:ATP-dependent exoDNAse (exonuclease V) alpha subunit